MIKIRNLFICLLLGSFFLMSAGCADPPEDATDYQAVFQDFQDGNTVNFQLSDRIHVEGSIEVPEKEFYSIVHARARSVEDPWAVYKVLEGDSPIDTMHSGETEENWLAVTEDLESYVAVNKRIGEISLTDCMPEYDPKFETRASILQVTRDPRGLLRAVEPDEDFCRTHRSIPTVEREEAIRNVRKILRDDLDIPVCDEPYVCVGITAQDMTQMLSDGNYDAVPDSAEPFYYMLWEEEINGLRLANGNNWSDTISQAIRSDYVHGSLDVTYYDEGGLFQLDTFRQYDVTGEEKETKVLPLSEAFLAAARYCDMMIPIVSVEITDVDFRYIPELTNSPEEETLLYDLIPGYIFTATYQEEETERKMYDLIYVNAVTGDYLYPTTRSSD